MILLALFYIPLNFLLGIFLERESYWNLLGCVLVFFVVIFNVFPEI
jgi:hypothetical protein